MTEALSLMRRYLTMSATALAALKTPADYEAVLKEAAPCLPEVGLCLQSDGLDIDWARVWQQHAWVHWEGLCMPRVNKHHCFALKLGRSGCQAWLSCCTTPLPASGWCDTVMSLPCSPASSTCMHCCCSQPIMLNKAVVAKLSMDALPMQPAHHAPTLELRSPWGSGSHRGCPCHGHTRPGSGEKEVQRLSKGLIQVVPTLQRARLGLPQGGAIARTP